MYVCVCVVLFRNHHIETPIMTYLFKRAALRMKKSGLYIRGKNSFVFVQLNHQSWTFVLPSVNLLLSFRRMVSQNKCPLIRLRLHRWILIMRCPMMRMHWGLLIMSFLLVWLETTGIFPWISGTEPVKTALKGTVDWSCYKMPHLCLCSLLLSVA